MYVKNLCSTRNNNIEYISGYPPPLALLIHISLLQHYHQTHLAGTNIFKDILELQLLHNFHSQSSLYTSFDLNSNLWLVYVNIIICRCWLCLFLIILTPSNNSSFL